MLKNNLDVLKHAKANRAKVITTDRTSPPTLAVRAM